MLSTIIFASVAFLGALTSAVDPRQVANGRRQVFIASITFQGASPDESYTLDCPTDDQPFAISKSLSLAFLHSREFPDPFASFYLHLLMFLSPSLAFVRIIF
jgi:hypothetical protein